MSSVEDRRQLILESTITCIIRSGFDGVRLRDVSKEAGVSVGLIQHYFDSRDELVSQAIAHLSEDLVEQFFHAASGAETAWARIEWMVDRLCEVPDLASHSHMWLALGGAVVRHPQLRPELERVYGAWQHYVHSTLELGVRNGEFDLIGDIDDVVATYLAFFDGYEYDMSTGLLPADKAELRRRSFLLSRSLFRPR